MLFEKKESFFQKIIMSKQMES